MHFYQKWWVHLKNEILKKGNRQKCNSSCHLVGTPVNFERNRNLILVMNIATDGAANLENFNKYNGKKSSKTLNCNISMYTPFVDKASLSLRIWGIWDMEEIHANVTAGMVL